ncbi:MAG: hypothetical protein AAGJ82_07475, partial [Bacteroidota bacterium]
MRLLLLSFSLLLTTTATAQAEAEQQLRTVNPHWAAEKWAMVEPFFAYLEPTEDWIQRHLQLVEHDLRSRPVHALTAAQKAKRTAALDHLRTYWQRGRFPVNTYHAERTPYFVDVSGTHCAVGYLLAQDGQTELVASINQRDNYAYVEDLANKYPALVDWAVANGFTVAELAWIQPSYPPIPREMDEVGNGGGADGPIHVMKVSPDESTLYLAGEFTQVDGVDANSIIAWDGDNWHTLGEGLIGEVRALHFHAGQLHAAGDFRLATATQNCNIARWNGAEWIGLQTGDSGLIRTMATYKNELYVGGEFCTLDNLPIQFLAYYDEALQRWSNDGYVLDADTLASIPGVFSVDSTVYSLIVYDSLLYVGGQFDELATNVTHPNHLQYEVNNLARWYGRNWAPINANVDLFYINHMTIKDEQLYLLGPYFLDFEVMQVYTTDTLFSKVRCCGILQDEEPPLMYGYLEYFGNYYLYGNIGAAIRRHGFVNYPGWR